MAALLSCAGMTTDEIRLSIESATRYLREHPEQARYTDPVATAKREDGLRFRVDGPNGRLVFTDMSKSVGGKESAPSPGWLLRAAHASCDATLIAMRAAQQGVVLDELEVTVDGESDDRGLLGIDDTIPAGPLSTRTRVSVSARGVSAERLREIVEWAEAHSPVEDSVRRAVPCKVEIQVE
jgi:uncharacterized OsmC-like protein